MLKCSLLACLSIACWAAAAVAAESSATLRPPAVPLVVHDPYFSIWSPADKLTDCWPMHWTGATQALCGLVRVDGQTYRIMGVAPAQQPALPQTRLEVLPTRTIYEFAGAGVRVELTFTTPVLPDDLDLLARPVTYLTWRVAATDNRAHRVQLYYDNSAELVVDKAEQAVVWSRPQMPGLTVLRMGSEAQPVLQQAGDNRRIDWGYCYVAAPQDAGAAMAVAGHDAARQGFCKTGGLPTADDTRMPRAANDDWPVMACAFDLGEVGAQPVARHLLLAYDDLYSIEFLGQRLRPYWRRKGQEMTEMLPVAARQYAEIVQRCVQFDQALLRDLTRVGGPQYAQLCALCYRHALGAHKLAAAPDGRPMLFSKECFSNGCIATVDVTYPTAPIFMLFSNDLLKALLNPMLDYAATDRWKFPFAPHDLGKYPKANGQAHGGGEKTEENQMPVEESGNLLLLVAAVARLDGNAAYAQRYWPQLAQWAAYLKDKGLDPPNQLCTDDFTGHLAHNTNLSIKAIMALGAYAQMCQMAGKTDEAAAYRRLAEAFAQKWTAMADDGDHYRLAFDQPDTWSQKYNLVWDKLFALDLFPARVTDKELAYYKKQLRPFGLPLDNRAEYTKLDWEVWTATLAANRNDFDALMAPVYAFVSHTQPRAPLTDWYWTTDAKLRSFRARPVVGGVFIKMLADPAACKTWQRPSTAQQ